MDYSLPGFSVHGILQARILEWVAFPLGTVYVCLYIDVYIYIYIYIYTHTHIGYINFPKLLFPHMITVI